MIQVSSSYPPATRSIVPGGAARVIPPYPEHPTVRVVPTSRGHTDETYLTPAQRVNRKKIQTGFYSYHDVVSILRF